MPPFNFPPGRRLRSLRDSTELDRCIRNEFFSACVSKDIIKFLLECFVFILTMERRFTGSVVNALSLSLSLVLFPFQRWLDCEELSRIERLATANIFIRSLKSHSYECPGTCRCPRPLEILSSSRGKPQSGKFRLRRNQQTVNSSSILARTASFPYFLANRGPACSSTCGRNGSTELIRPGNLLGLSAKVLCANAGGASELRAQISLDK